jgi:hypothetical protein
MRIATAAMILACSIITTLPVYASTIEGVVIDAVARYGLPSEDDPFVLMGLHRLEESSGFVEVAVTNCSTAQGCSDHAGSFRFNADFEGRELAPGRYELKIWDGNGDYVMTRKEFDFDGDWISLGALPLRKSPVHIDIWTIPHDLPAGGGGVEVHYKIVNSSGHALAVTINGMVLGSGLFSSWIMSPFRYSRATLADTLVSMDRVAIPASVPNGFWYCFRIAAEQPGNPFLVYAEAQKCILVHPGIPWVAG